MQTKKRRTTRETVKKEHYVNKEVKDFYQQVKQIRVNNKSIYCRNKEGLLLHEIREKLKRWAEYVEDLLNKEEEIEPETQTQTQENDPEQAEEAVNKVVKDTIKDLKNNKSAGEREILTDILK
ncbi:hypothetical protein ILUMI_10152 [Ignelater luminosus]|uniref:Uncharacterized protein n=1 Tax=Ignelater luminosus TaxID=2038154 RepID=A0A8K0GBR3_IGNLU|nr:hypothetical protein ILUMI_10152 [Ignelater luminosus]